MGKFVQVLGAANIFLLNPPFSILAYGDIKTKSAFQLMLKYANCKMQVEHSIHALIFYNWDSWQDALH